MEAWLPVSLPHPGALMESKITSQGKEPECYSGMKAGLHPSAFAEKSSIFQTCLASSASIPSS